MINTTWWTHLMEHVTQSYKRRGVALEIGRKRKKEAKRSPKGEMIQVLRPRETGREEKGSTLRTPCRFRSAIGLKTEPTNNLGSR
ncbi:unnamed protein product, partial [Musa banksii]